MNLKDEMRLNARIVNIFEMAQQHFDDKVVNLIKAGKYKEAAQRYIDNHGNSKVPQKAEATTKKLQTQKFAKTLKARPEQVEGITDEEWSKFNTAFSELQGTQLQTKRGYTKTKGKVETSTDEIKTSRSGIKSHGSKIESLETKISRLAKEFGTIKTNAEDEKTKQEAQEHIDGLKILHDALQHVKKGENVLPPETKEEIEKLKERYKKIGKAYIEKFKPRLDVTGEEEPAYDEEVAKSAIQRLVDKMNGVKDLEDVDALWGDWAKRKRQLQDKEANRAKDVQMKENLNLKGVLIADGTQYEGVNFWDNYIMSGLVRGFNEDIKQLGVDKTISMYVEVFDIDTLPIYEYMISNLTLLNESANMKNYYLFEEVGYNNIINELDLTTTKSALMGGGFNAVKKTPKIIEFLKGLWDKIKQFGKPIVDKLSKFVGAGVTWAKNIATKGLAWLQNNPIARVAVPVVALAGGIVGGIALLNKLRKRAGKEKLTKQEEDQIADIAKEKENELKKLGAKV